MEQIKENPEILNPTSTFVKKRIKTAMEILRRVSQKLGMLGINMKSIPDFELRTKDEKAPEVLYSAAIDMKSLNIILREGWLLEAEDTNVFMTLGHEVEHAHTHPKNARIDATEQKILKENIKQLQDTMVGELHNLYSDTVINRAALYSPLGEDKKYVGYAKGMMVAYGQTYQNKESEYVRWLFYKEGWTKDEILKKYPSWKNVVKHHTEDIKNVKYAITREYRGIDNVLAIPPSVKDTLRWTGHPVADLGFTIHMFLQYMAVLDYQWKSREQMFKWVQSDTLILILENHFGDIIDNLIRLYLLAHFPAETGHSDRREAMIEYCEITYEMILRTDMIKDWSAGTKICEECLWVDMDHNFKLTDLSWREIPNQEIKDAFEITYTQECPKCATIINDVKVANIKRLRDLEYYHVMCSTCGKPTMVPTEITTTLNDITIHLNCESPNCGIGHSQLSLNPFFGVECTYCGGWSAPGYHRHQEIIKNMNKGTVSQKNPSDPNAPYNPHEGQEIPSPHGKFRYWLWTQCLQCENTYGELAIPLKRIKKRTAPTKEAQAEDIIARNWRGM